MSRRIEITVPNDWAEAVRECLEDPERCNLGDHSEKANMIVELPGLSKTLFFVTVPGPGVSPALEALRKSGFGVKVGRIILSSLEYMKPDLSKPMIPLELLPEEDQKAFGKKAKALKGLKQFIKARRTTEELFSEISNNANMTINTWLNLIGASVMAAGGLATGATVFIVAAMLVSPIMGPILGMTFGYRVADWPLFKAGFYSEVKMVATAFFTGFFCGLVLGSVGTTYNWPTSAMMGNGQAYNLVISVIVSAAAGMVLAVSMSSPSTNALVGTAISAGLLPPLVNCGMLISYSATYAAKEDKYRFYEMGSYSFVFYLTHVITILIVANLVFWLKDIDPRFRQGDDADFDDIPSLREHKDKMKRLGENSATGGERVKFQQFMSHAMADLKGDTQDGLMDLKDGAMDMANRMKGVFTGETSFYPGRSGRNRTNSGAVNATGRVGSDVSGHGNNSNNVYDIDNNDVENRGSGGSGVEGSGNPNAVLFKRHKVYTSPNILAEEAEFQSTTINMPLPQSTSSKLNSLSAVTVASSSSTRYRSGVPSTTIAEGDEYNKKNKNSTVTTNMNNRFDTNMNDGDDDDYHATVMNPLLQQQQHEQQTIPTANSSSRLLQHQSQPQVQILSPQQQRERELMRSSVQTDDSTGDGIL